MKKWFILLMLLPSVTFSQIKISNKVEDQEKFFPIVSKNSVISILYDDAENILVKKSAAFLAGDIEKVTNKRPRLQTSAKKLDERIILVGTVGSNPLIEKLVSEKKLNLDLIKGQWERFIIQTIDNPFEGVKEALVIVGSDRRGAAYGAFTLSKEMGVSPWYWWADVPILKKEEVYLERGVLFLMVRLLSIVASSLMMKILV